MSDDAVLPVAPPGRRRNADTLSLLQLAQQVGGHEVMLEQTRTDISSLRGEVVNIQAHLTAQDAKQDQTQESINAVAKNVTDLVTTLQEERQQRAPLDAWIKQREQEQRIHEAEQKQRIDNMRHGIDSLFKIMIAAIPTLIGTFTVLLLSGTHDQQRTLSIIVILVALFLGIGWYIVFHSDNKHA